MTENLPLVSVVIASYNSAEFIEETIHSVLNQSYSRFEIIVVDDGSTDGTADAVMRLTSLDNRIKFYQTTHSGRPSVPRNYGTKKAEGDLVAFLDSDDLWTKHKLKYQVNYLMNHPDLSFIYSMCFTFGEVNFFSEHYELLPLPFRAAKNNKDLRKIGNTIPLSSVLIRKPAFDAVGGFDEDPEFKAVEDYDLWLRLSDKYLFNFIPRIHFYYRIHGAQSSADWETREKRLQLLAEKKNIKLPHYKNIRRKGMILLLIRNALHLEFYLLYRIIGYIENGDGLR
jgi:teichuronic acid biosynthesis glycosyltransferase TuaG